LGGSAGIPKTGRIVSIAGSCARKKGAIGEEAAMTEAAVQGRGPAIVFDLGGVLIDWDPRHLYRQLFDGDEAAMERFLAEVCNSEWNVRQDAGRPFAEAVAELVQRHPEQRALIEAYHLRWPEMVAGPIDGSVEILAELRESGHELHALTNWSAETFALTRPRFAFLAWFESILVSAEVRLIKPDPRIFRLLLERIGREAKACIYIDDSPKNVAAADVLGFDAIHFQGAAALRAGLVRRGLLLGGGPGR
jgi:2-haloacid dehalogenase